MDRHFIKRIALLSLTACYLIPATGREKGLTSYVNTFQGSLNTGEFSHGRLSPLAVLPHRTAAWIPTGFSYAEGCVSGVSCLGLSFFPEGDGRLDKENSLGRPEYLRVRMSSGTLMEVTPAPEGGIAVFTFPRKAPATIRVEAGQEGNINLDTGAKSASGFVVSKSPHHLITDTVWFKLVFDKPFQANGSSTLSFRSPSKVTVKASFSKISHSQADLNYRRSLLDKSFEEVMSAAESEWNDALGRILVEGGTLEQRRTFYSCLFRTMLRPAIDYEYDDTGKAVFRFNGDLHEGKYHSNPILWDAYRCLFALNNVINTSLQKEYLPSLIKTQDLLGWWPNGHVMIGNHAISVLCDAWAKGIRNFDPEDVLERYANEITRSRLETDVNAAYNADHLRGFGRMGFEDYFSLGYIPYPQGTDRVMETTSKTIEYNYDDFCAWKLAQMTGNRFYEDMFSRHIYNYRNVFDPEDQFFKGRDRKGRFDEDFNPFEWGGPFVEGNAWQWRFSVQQDAKGMIDLMGGERRFLKNLDSLFTSPGDSVLSGGYGYRIHEINEAVAGGQGQYAQGNEPCFHVIHLYNHAGQPWKAQKLLRDSMERLFSSGPDGFPGDEDGGAMSAWYVFNAMGFYPVTPGVPQYVIGSPLFDSVTINLESGKTFQIVASGNGRGSCYISKAILNGKEVTRSWITHEELMNGGRIEFAMSKEPDYDRGIYPEDRPYSMSDENNGHELMSGNPLFEGRYADPEVAVYEGEYWIFPTTSGRPEKPRFDAFSSPDLKNWKKHESIFGYGDNDWIKNCLWAPATVCKDGKYYLFFSANDIQHPESKWWNPEVNKIGEIGGIGVAVADRPEGPYRDLIGKPLINEFYNMAQPIDQFVFLWKDKYYIVYGGWGRCNVGILNEDFTALVPFEDGSMVMWKDRSCSRGTARYISCGPRAIGQEMTIRLPMLSQTDRSALSNVKEQS